MFVINCMIVNSHSSLYLILKVFNTFISMGVDNVLGLCKCLFIIIIIIIIIIATIQNNDKLCLEYFPE